MKTWDDWSDEELSSEIMGVVHGEQVKHWCLSDCGEYVYDCGPAGDQFYQVPVLNINNWSDMGPIVAESGVSLIKLGGDYIAVGGQWDYIDISEHDDAEDCCIGANVIRYAHKNPLRAAAVVFLELNGIKR